MALLLHFQEIDLEPEPRSHLIIHDLEAHDFVLVVVLVDYSFRFHLPLPLQKHLDRTQVVSDLRQHHDVVDSFVCT